MAYGDKKLFQILLERDCLFLMCTPCPNFLGETVTDFVSLPSACVSCLTFRFFGGGGEGGEGRMPSGCVDDEMPLSTFSNILKSADYYHYR